MVKLEYFQPFSSRGCYPGSYEEEAVQALLFEIGAVPADFMSPTLVKLVHHELLDRFDQIKATDERRELDREFLRQAICHWRHYRRERNHNYGFTIFEPKQLKLDVD